VDGIALAGVSSIVDQFCGLGKYCSHTWLLYGNLSVLKTATLPPAGLAFLVFQIFFIPCVGTVAAIQQETKSWKWTLTSVGMHLALSLGLAVAVFQIGRLF